MKKIIKYSKSYKNLLSLKKDLYKENKDYLKKLIRVNKFYIKQKKRSKCKNCNFKVGKKDFVSRLVSYSICKKCGHLNGMHQDSDKFIRYLYSDNRGENYYPNYKSDYTKRVKNIYEPKIKFLKQVVKDKIKILDIGSGAGQLLKACENLKIPAEGYETNLSLVNHGKTFLKKNKLHHTSIEDTYSKLLSSNANTLVMISVLEHLQQPQKIIDNFKKSNLKYLYFCVPLFSFAVMLENIFQKVYPRVCGGAHTHLYTEKSINFLAKKNKLKIIGEWWFGADIPDLFRIFINQNNNNDNIDLIYKFFNKTVDDLQNVIDKRKLCAQVHIVLKK